MAANYRRDPYCSLYILIYMRTVPRVGKSNYFIVLWVNTLINGFMGSTLNFYEYQNHKWSQILNFYKAMCLVFQLSSFRQKTSPQPWQKGDMTMQSNSGESKDLLIFMHLKILIFLSFWMCVFAESCHQELWEQLEHVQNAGSRAPPRDKGNAEDQRCCLHP